MKLVFLVAALALAPGCKETPTSTSTEDAATPTPTTDAAVVAPTASINFAISADDAVNEEFADELVIGEVHLLRTLIRIPAEPGLSFARFELWAPTGDVFLSSYHAFTTQVDAPAKVPHPTLPFDLPVQRVSLDDDGFVQLTKYIKLRGSIFHRRRLTGLYTARIFLGSGSAGGFAAESQVMFNSEGGQ